MFEPDANSTQSFIDQGVIPARFKGANLPQDGRGVAPGHPGQTPDRHPPLGMRKIPNGGLGDPGTDVLSRP